MILLGNKYKTKVHKVVLDAPTTVAAGAITLAPGTYRYAVTPDRMAGAGVREIADDNKQHAIVTPATYEMSLNVRLSKINHASLYGIVRDLLRGKQ